MKNPRHLSKPKHALSGILYMTAASLAFAVMAVCVKLTARTLPIFEVVFFRSLSGTLLISFLILKKGVTFRGKDKRKLILRGLSGFIALSLHFYTISKLPLGMAVLLNYTAPVYAALLGFFFLNEKPSFFLWCMILVSFLGVYLLTFSPKQPWNPPNLHSLVHQEKVGYEIKYVLLGLLSGLAAAVAYTSIRAIKHGESPLTIIFYFTFISTIGSSFFLLKGIQWPEAVEWWGLLGVAIGSFYGQLWMTIAFRRAPAYLVSPFSYLTPAFSFLMGSLLWKDPITAYTFGGAGLIFLAGCWISLREAAYE